MTTPQGVTRLAELIHRAGIPIDEIGSVSRVSLYQEVDETGSGGWIRFDPTWKDGPAWPVVQPAKPCSVRPSAAKPRSTGGTVTVVLPDPQIGFWRHDNGDLTPMHDEQAMGVALAVIAHVKPDRIVNLGDFMDFAEWSSKFAVSPEFVAATQPTLDRAHRFLAEQIAAAGPTLRTVDLLEGNHDNRLALAIVANAKSALRLRRAETPESWPVLSVPHLLRLDELGVVYHGAYPAGRVRLADPYGRQAPLVARHGHSLDMAKIANTEHESVVQGHAHHVALATQTRVYDGVPREVEAWSLGCLCRVDGAVPSTAGGSDARGRPVVHHESWQQAVGVVTETGHGWDVEPVRIRDGYAFYRGKELVA